MCVLNTKTRILSASITLKIGIIANLVFWRLLWGKFFNRYPDPETFCESYMKDSLISTGLLWGMITFLFSFLIQLVAICNLSYPVWTRKYIFFDVVLTDAAIISSHPLFYLYFGREFLYKCDRYGPPIFWIFLSLMMLIIILDIFMLRPIVYLSDYDSKGGTKQKQMV